MAHQSPRSLAKTPARTVSSASQVRRMLNNRHEVALRALPTPPAAVKKLFLASVQRSPLGPVRKMLRTTGHLPSAAVQGLCFAQKSTLEVLFSSNVQDLLERIVETMKLPGFPQNSSFNPETDVQTILRRPYSHCQKDKAPRSVHGTHEEMLP